MLSNAAGRSGKEELINSFFGFSHMKTIGATGEIGERHLRGRGQDKEHCM